MLVGYWYDFSLGLYRVGGYVRLCIAFNMVVGFFAWILVCVGFCLLPLGSDVIVPFGQFT